MHSTFSGAKLREARIRSGLSQKHFAELMEVSNHVLSRWERDCNRPHPAVIEKMETLLMAGPGGLLTGGPAPEPAPPVIPQERVMEPEPAVVPFVAPPDVFEVTLGVDEDRTVSVLAYPATIHVVKPVVAEPVVEPVVEAPVVEKPSRDFMDVLGCDALKLLARVQMPSMAAMARLQQKVAVGARRQELSDPEFDLVESGTAMLRAAQAFSVAARAYRLQYEYLKPMTEPDPLEVLSEEERSNAVAWNVYAPVRRMKRRLEWPRG